jgi:hypothetical protein
MVEVDSCNKRRVSQDGLSLTTITFEPRSVML